MGAKCFARAQWQASTWETFWVLFWLPELCRKWCNAAWEEEKLNTFIFPYPDWSAFGVCDGNAIYDKSNFIDKTYREYTASQKSAIAEKINDFLKAHPQLKNAKPEDIKAYLKAHPELVPPAPAGSVK